MTDKPTPTNPKDLKVNDKVMYILHDNCNGIEMEFGMIGVIKSIRICRSDCISALIVWEGYEKEIKSLAHWMYDSKQLMRMRNKPDYSSITKLIATGA